jgi:DNA-directed RNA polymerase subunit M/transcription elongation factor TFIIS
MAAAFCKETGSLLEVAVSNTGELVFKSKEGVIYQATKEQTLIVGEDLDEAKKVGSYQNTLNVTAFDPINARTIIENGCPKCGRKLISSQLIGQESKKRVFVCLCGNTF